MKRTTITLPDELADLVGREARRRETSVSELVRRLIVKGLGSGETREIPWAGIFDDPGMVSGADLERGLEEWESDIDRDRG